MKRFAGTVGLVALMVLSFWFAGRFHEPLINERSEFTPGVMETLDENAPPLVALTQVALGGFRGLLADALWLRVTRVQEEGKYFEIVQLSDWITKLEPRFTPAWAYHAWNMAYNVSVLLDDPAERWRWIKQGISILRDRSLMYNPSDPQLHWELGWLFQHKIGQNLDQYHMYYKTEWAREMQNLLGGPIPDFDRLLAAATSRADLMKRPGVSELIQAIETLGADPFDLDALQSPEAPEKLTARLALPAATDELLPYLVRKRMVETYRLKPEMVYRIEQEFGPLDWRMPQAHAIYWAEKGREFSEYLNLIRMERMTFQSLADAFRAGTAFWDLDGNLIPSSNLDLLPRVRAAFERGLEENEGNATILTAYQNFLTEAIGLLNIYHRIDEAKALYKDLQTLFPSPETEVSFEVFVVASLGENIERLSSREAANLIEAMIQQSLMWYAMGDLDRYAGFERFARLLWKKYMDGFTSEEHKDRVRLAPFPAMMNQGLERLIESVDNDIARERLELLLQRVRQAEAAAGE